MEGSALRPIVRIEGVDVARLHAGQVIVDLSSAVKELLENALDARATQVAVELEGYGAKGVCVTDNGCGISSRDFGALARKHHTSKLRDFDELNAGSGVESFGFRGEALSALASLGRLVVTTRTAGDASATRLEFDAAGELVSQAAVSHPVGSAVCVTELFRNLPVRQEEFVKNIKREYGKLVPLVQAYGLVCGNVKVALYNTTAGGKRQLVYSSSGRDSLQENAVLAFGAKEAKALDAVQADFIAEHGFAFRGLVSALLAGTGRRAKDRHFFFVNRRPVDLPQLGKVITDCYRVASQNLLKFPTIVLDLTVRGGDLDLNVTPDKRTIFLSGENKMLECCRDVLTRHYAAAMGAVSFDVNAAAHTGSIPSLFPSQAAPPPPDRSRSAPMRFAAAAPVLQSSMETFGVRRNSEPAVSPRSAASHQDAAVAIVIDVDADEEIEEEGGDKGVKPEPVTPPTRPRFSEFAFGSAESAGAPPAAAAAAVASSPAPLRTPSASLADVDADDLMIVADDFDDCCARAPKNRPPVADETALVPKGGKLFDAFAFGARPASPKRIKKMQTLDDDDDDENNAAAAAAAVVFGAADDVLSPIMAVKASSPMFASSGVVAARLSGDDSSPAGRCTLSVDLSEIKRTLKRRRAAGKDPRLSEHELASASFRKEYFKRLRVVGQFNNGFIVTRFDTSPDLFIVDQHASNEIFNFEALQKTTILKPQPLLAPIVVAMAPDEEVEVAQNLAAFQRNGFLLEYDEEAPPGRKVRMCGRPESKDMTFGEEDVRELLGLLRDSGGGGVSHVRPSRVRAMFASRACRMSVMIGTPLSHEKMVGIVSDLATLDAPWACPHGRPTFRHLYKIEL